LRHGLDGFHDRGPFRVARLLARIKRHHLASLQPKFPNGAPEELGEVLLLGRR